MDNLDAGQYPITRHLPKTGQTLSWGVGDDGDYQSGWWRGRMIANNKTRLLSRTISGDDVVIDRATGLMWPKDFSGAGGNMGVTRTWSQATIWALVLNFAGFTDWTLPNAFELLSLAVLAGAAPHIDPIFDNRVSADFWSSTTRPTMTTWAYLVNWTTDPVLTYLLKTFSFRVIAVRESRL